ncbi:hypothetical protein AAG906_001745 [Vitis piasezkii]
MRIDELVSSIQTYEMTIPSSQKPKDFAFKAFENEEKDIEIPYDITRDELSYMTKMIKRKEKGSSKDKKIECFNCGGLRHYAHDCPSPKDIKKFMQTTWSDTNSEEIRFASMESVHDSDRDSDSDDKEFIDEQKAEFLNNLIVMHERLIKSYMKDYDILETHKNKIDMLDVEKISLLEKIRFLEFEHHSLLEKNNVLTQKIKNNKPSLFVNENFHPGTKVLNEILDKCKVHGDKRGLGYINKDETPSNGETLFVKAKSSSVWYLDSGCFRHMIVDKYSFTSLENYNSGTITFGNRSLARVKGKGSMVIPTCPKLDGVLYVDRFNANLLSISQMCDKE